MKTSRLDGFCKGWRPDGVMLNLGQRSKYPDVWSESNELNFVVGGPAGDMQFLPVSADFIRHFPHMSAVGARQYPQQGPVLEPGSGGGSEPAAFERPIRHSPR